MPRAVHPTRHDAAQGSLRAYITGFISSVVLTLTAFTFVYIHTSSDHETFSHHFLIPLVIVLAVIQFAVQLRFFLHVSRESSQRWNLAALVLALIVVLIVVVGSLWIMSNLNYRMMRSPELINQYLNSQGDL